MFSASWENGNLDIVLIKPDNTIITPVNAASHGVSITPSDGELTKGITFSVRATSGSTLPTGEWKLRLGAVGSDMLPGVTNNYSLPVCVRSASTHSAMESIATSKRVWNRQSKLGCQPR